MVCFVRLFAVWFVCGALFVGGGEAWAASARKFPVSRPATSRPVVVGQKRVIVDKSKLNQIFVRYRRANWRLRYQLAQQIAGYGPVVLPWLGVALGNARASTRQAAAQALRLFGAKALPVASSIVGLLGHKDEFVRRDVADSLMYMGHAFVPRVLAHLPFRRLQARILLCQLFRKVGAPAKDAMHKALQSRVPRLRRNGAFALGCLASLPDDIAKTLRVAINDPEVAVQQQALAALGKARTNRGLAIAALCTKVDATHWLVRQAAIWSLGNLAPPVDPTLRSVFPLLRKALKDKHPYVRRAAARAWLQMGREGMVALPALLEAFSDRDRGVKHYVARSLQGFLQAPKALASSLRLLLKQSRHSLYAPILQLLSGMGPEGIPLGKELAVMLESTSRRWDRPVVMTWMKMGPKLLPTMLPLLSHPASHVRKQVLFLMGQYGPKAAPHLKHIVRSLRAKEWEVRRTGVWVLWRMKEKGALAIPHVAGMLKDPHPQVRRMAASGLGYLGPKVVSVLPLLANSLQDTETSVRYSAAFAMGKVGPKAGAYAMSLAVLLQSKQKKLRIVGAWAIGKLKAQGSPAVPALQKALLDPSWSVRHYAAEALGRIGPAAAVALPGLGRLVKDKHVLVRKKSVLAIARILRDLPVLRRVLKKATKDADAGVAQSAKKVFRQLWSIAPATRPSSRPVQRK